jgi:hypothetical protein
VPGGRAERWREHAAATRIELTRIESLPIGRAVRLIEMQRAQAAVQVEVERTRPQLGAPTERRVEQTDPELSHGI